MSTRTGQPEHRRLFSFTDLSKPTSSAPRHSTGAHVHVFVEVARFDGLRESIAQCGCGDTRTVFHTAAQA